MNKKLLYITSLFALMAVGCAKEQDYSASLGGAEGVNLLVSKSEVTGDGATDVVKKNFAGAAGDTLHVAFEPASNNPMVGTYVSDGSAWLPVSKSEQLMWPDGDIDSDVLAYFVGGGKKTVATLKGFELSGDQSTPEKLAAEDLFYSFEKDRPHGEGSLELDFKRVMAKVQLQVIYATEKFGQVTDVVFKSTPAGIDVADGLFEVDYSYSSKDLKAYRDNSKVAETSFLNDTMFVTAYVLPHDWQQRVEFHFDKNPEGPSYFTSSAGSGTYTKLEAGKQYTARLTISGTEVTFNSNIEVSPWETPVAQEGWFSTADVWDGVYPTEGYGTLAECGDFDPTTNTLTLSTPAQFAKFAMYTVAGDDIPSYTSGNALAYCTGVTIKLGANIDLGNKPFFPLGGKFYPDGKGTARMTMGAFNGTFDGDGYEIRNLLLEPTAHDSYNTTGDKLALFYTFDNYPGFIKNLTLRGVTAVSSQALKIAAFLAYGNGGGMIRNCKLYDATIECSKFNGYAGGILAQTWTYVDIIDCHVGSDVSVTGKKYVGGIIGCMPIKGIIAYCSSAASVSSTQGYAGGIAGEFGVQSTPFKANQTYLLGVGYPMMIGCQASGVVTSTSQSGGLVGYNAGLIAGCYSTAVMVNTSTSKPQPNGKLIGQNCELGAKIFVPNPSKPDYIHNQPSIYGCFAPESDADSTFFCVGTIKLFDYNPAAEKYTWKQQTYPDPIAEVNNFDNSKFVSTQVTNFATPVSLSAEPRSMLYKGAISQKEVDIMNEAIALFTTSDGYLPFQTTTLENAEDRASLRNYKLQQNKGYDSDKFPYKAVYTQPNQLLIKFYR